MPRDTKKAQSALLSKGFCRDDSHHHYFMYCTTDGKRTTVKTHTSHNSKELNDFLIGRMAKQCKLTKSQFLNLIDCSLDQVEYEKILRESCIIPPIPPTGSSE